MVYRCVCFGKQFYQFVEVITVKKTNKNTNMGMALGMCFGVALGSAFAGTLFHGNMLWVLL